MNVLVARSGVCVRAGFEILVEIFRKIANERFMSPWVPFKQYVLGVGFTGGGLVCACICMEEVRLVGKLALVESVPQGEKLSESKIYLKLIENRLHFNCSN